MLVQKLEKILFEHLFGDGVRLIMKEQIKEIHNLIQDLNEKADAERTEVQAIIADLKGAVAGFEVKVAELQAKVNELEAEVSVDLSEDIAAFKAGIEKLEMVSEPKPVEPEV